MLCSPWNHASLLLENADVRNCSKQQRAPQSQPNQTKGKSWPHTSVGRSPKPGCLKMSHGQVGARRFQNVFGKLPIKWFTLHLSIHVQINCYDPGYLGYLLEYFIDFETLIWERRWCQVRACPGQEAERQVWSMGNHWAEGQHSLGTRISGVEVLHTWDGLPWSRKEAHVSLESISLGQMELTRRQDCVHCAEEFYNKWSHTQLSQSAWEVSRQRMSTLDSKTLEIYESGERLELMTKSLKS